MKNVARELRVRIVQELLAELCSTGHWRGELASSPLATATAAFALTLVDRDKYAHRIHKALRWICHHINNDGGWGDCERAPSNLSATLLCWCALSMHSEKSQVAARAEGWITRRVGSIEPSAIADSVIKHYGDDRTFSTPVLAMCALAGSLGSAPWSLVPQLPLELAVFPSRFYNRLRLPVVSYALPALISLGFVRHHHLPVPGIGLVRNFISRRVLNTLSAMQPENGGFLEATPLTAFVLMSLVACGCKSHEVVRRGVRFLLSSQRDDGSWPVDSDLATWLTTLAVNGGIAEHLNQHQRRTIRSWLLKQQFTNEHPLTHAGAGGWAWTDLPGGVPDADDTAGALLALPRLGPIDKQAQQAAETGVRWLLDLQNPDGGMPTFCRGWGRFAFDRSCPAVTAHVLRAWSEWRGALSPLMQLRLRGAIRRGLEYLANCQAQEGSWAPLWFGNPWSPSQTNPTWGTAWVVLALSNLRVQPTMRQKGIVWLVSAQNPDGGWGGAPGVRSSAEDTALAVAALSTTREAKPVQHGLRWLVEHQGNDPTPIGLYFASLWYYEKLYPQLFTLHALSALGISPGHGHH